MLSKALGVGEEKALLRCIPIDWPGTAIALQSALHRIEAGESSAVVGDVLAQCEPAIHVESVHLDVAVVLLHDQRRLLREMRRIGGTPPVTQIAVGIIVAALVVEAVCELVTRP